MNENPRKHSVTLEDLLRVKRAEQPPAEFWDSFERGMRTKQLAAIVEPRPWWAPLIRIGTRVARYQVPVGATAILAVTFLTLREYRSVDVRPVNEPAVAAITVSAATNTPAVAADSMMTTSAPETTSAPMSISELPVAASAPTSIPADPNTQATAMVGASSHVVPVQTELTPSARYIAENLAAARAADPELDQMLGRSIRNLENRVARTEPLTQVSMPGGSRRSRLLGGTAWLASVTTGSDSQLRSDNDSARRLTERRLSESDAVSRIDVGGDRFTVKF